jgi:LPP20 lipoprotein
MNKKYYRSPLILWIFLFFLTPKTFATYQPPWLQEYLDGTFELPSYYYGIGFAPFVGNSPNYEARRLAKNRALDELCYQISVSVKSQFEEKLVQKSPHTDQEEVTISLFVSTRKVLSGIKEKENWTDPNKRRYWVLVVIDKAEANHQIEHQRFFNDVVDRIDNTGEWRIEAIKKINTVLDHRKEVFAD